MGSDHKVLVVVLRDGREYRLQARGFGEYGDKFVVYGFTGLTARWAADTIAGWFWSHSIDE